MKDDAEDTMSKLATLLDEVLNEKLSDNKYKFCLLVLEREGETGARINHVSNIDRPHAIAALKLLLDRLEKQAH